MKYSFIGAKVFSLKGRYDWPFFVEAWRKFKCTRTVRAGVGGVVGGTIGTKAPQDFEIPVNPVSNNRELPPHIPPPTTPGFSYCPELLIV